VVEAVAQLEPEPAETVAAGEALPLGSERLAHIDHRIADPGR